ncbi:hypothetical protein SSX86_033083 [Deinandra increscens subsp. villosa]|uniref:Small ribosomal subunit protein mS38 n=1 Tax=Deinandra increscens subsp. villosa TaxID=3103831 RepID=A0AAP0GGE5_9ASTR
MASFLQRIVRKQSRSTALISNLNKQLPSSPTILLDPKPLPAIPFFNNLPKTTDESNLHHHSSTFYPTFSFSAFLHPVSQIGYIQSVLPEEDDVNSGDDERGIWADSVKKKRKKKMNKHKLKKLRKRLRRKT